MNEFNFNNTKGSIWRKWDLHIHTNASDGKASPEEIIQKAKEKGLAVIAITDHHTVKSIDEAKKFGKENGITVISGIEFKTNTGKKAVHVIGLFPDRYNGFELDGKYLYESILCKLNLKDDDLKQKGKEKNSDFSDEEAFKEGLLLASVEIKVVCDLIHEYGGIVVIHNGTKVNGLDKEVNHMDNSNGINIYECLGSLKKEIMNNYVDICEIRNKDDSAEFYFKEFEKPSIKASDAHKLKEVGRKFTWIKADTTFEGLKQILYEPASRVCLEEFAPQEKTGYHVISEVEIKHEDFGNQSIPLNPNLNTIIGGRSSGKSILLGCIAKKLNSERKVKENNDNYNRYIDKLLSSVKITWKDGEDGEDGNKRNVDYFPQSYINKLSADSDGLKQILENIIENDAEKKELLQNNKSFNANNKTKIINEITKYFELMRNTKELKKQVQNTGDKSGIEKEIDKLLKKLDELKSNLNERLSDEEEKEYLKKKEEIIKLERLISDAEDQIKKFDNLKEWSYFKDYDSLVNDFNDKLKTELSEIIDRNKENFIKALTEDFDKLLGSLKKEKEKNNEKLNCIKSSELYKKGNAFYFKNKEIQKTDNQLEVEKNKLNEITQLQKEVNQKKDELDRIKNSIISNNIEFFSHLENCINQLCIKKDTIKITANIYFNDQEFRSIIGNSFDKRIGKTKELLEYEYEYGNQKNHHKFLGSLFNKIINNEICEKSESEQQTLINDIYSESYFELRYDVFYQGDNISLMSEGKKAYIILRLLLDFDENEWPILIDQPEDDLDNRDIYNNLVKYLAEKKKKRQIILVTHNPNIVVGADAEEVIVANQNSEINISENEIQNTNQSGIKFEYLSGSLESTKQSSEKYPVLIRQGIKEHVCEILEGGYEAFVKRENRYGFGKKT